MGLVNSIKAGFARAKEIVFPSKGTKMTVTRLVIIGGTVAVLVTPFAFFGGSEHSVAYYHGMMHQFGVQASTYLDGNPLGVITDLNTQMAVGGAGRTAWFTIMVITGGFFALGIILGFVRFARKLKKG